MTPNEMQPLDDSDSENLIFKGLRVADLTWAVAGPVITKYLADRGATVVKVESSTHPDNLRRTQPFKDDVPGLNRSGFFLEQNTSKRSIAVDLSTDEGKQVVRDLIRWSDIVAENFRPGTMERFGFDYETLRVEQPDLIMVRTSMLGSNIRGQEGAVPGYGMLGAGLSGLHYLTGWPDRLPGGPSGAYTDSITPRFGICALMAALYHREKTGAGQLIDIAQVEAGVQMLAPMVLDYTINGSVTHPAGNRVRWAVPHGVFPCRGDDRWVSLSVENPEQWRGLLDAMGGPSWNADGRFDSVLVRLREIDLLEAHIADWTKQLDAFEAVDVLARSGVPAALVEKTSDLFDDPQLIEREHFRPLPHPEVGMPEYNAPAFRMSDAPYDYWRGAPCLGEDTETVLSDCLGYSSERIRALSEAGILR